MKRTLWNHLRCEHRRGTRPMRVSERDETAHHERGTDEKDYRHRDLHHDQRRLDTQWSATARPARLREDLG